MPHAKIKLQGAQAISLTALLTGSFRDTVLRHGFIYLFIYFAGLPKVICMAFNI